jgi:hypothetical protein
LRKTTPLLVIQSGLIGSARNLLAASREKADSSRDTAALRNDNSFGDFQITPLRRIAHIMIQHDFSVH